MPRAKPKKGFAWANGRTSVDARSTGVDSLTLEADAFAGALLAHASFEGGAQRVVAAAIGEAPCRLVDAAAVDTALPVSAEIEGSAIARLHGHVALGIAAGSASRGVGLTRTLGRRLVIVVIIDHQTTRDLPRAHRHHGAEPSNCPHDRSGIRLTLLREVNSHTMPVDR